MKEIEKRFFDEFAEHVFESLYYFIAIDNRANIVYLNEAYARLIGGSVSDFVGKPVVQVIPNTGLPQLLESGRDELGSYISVANLKTGETTRAICNRIVIRRDGKPDGEILGAIAESVIRDFQDTDQVYAELKKLKAQNQLYESYLSEVFQASSSIDNILGNSPAITRMKKVLEKVAHSQISVCICGETGTGKELVANAIHKSSGRADGPFIKVNCAAIPKELLEAELFGYEAGAFTGASRKGKIGKFELANHGTLLLDEIGEMPLVLQAKLLRVLQEKEIERIGGTHTIPLDVRVICSTNRDLPRMVREGAFRSDLYYRINTMELSVPPLRERLEDLPILCPHFVTSSNERNGLSIQGIAEDVYDLFRSYSWPGNIRELEHTIERASVMQGSGILTASNFVFLRQRMGEGGGVRETAGPSIRLQKEELERQAIVKTLQLFQGNKAAAARYLHMDRSTLYQKLKRYGL